VAQLFLALHHSFRPIDREGNTTFNSIDVGKGGVIGKKEQEELLFDWTFLHTEA
jgi:hypothetical protein